MSFYVSDTNDSTGSMIPDNLPSYVTPHVTAPAGNIIQHRPSSVFIKDNLNGDVSFNFTTTGSVGDTVGSNGTWVNYGGLSGSAVTLDISPTAWKVGASTYTAGAVIFNYNNGRPDGEGG